MEPLVLFIVDSKAIIYNKETLFSEENDYTELDTSQKSLSEICKYGIRDVVDSIEKKRELNK